MKNDQVLPDGFCQFISFLLTISAESATNQLSNSLLLLNEPETHLHPQAQEYLKDELIKITRNDENVYRFQGNSGFIFARIYVCERSKNSPTSAK
ncbi:MAG: AAA family ATPase [bacterium]|nr:AAA family ATPase [bacterium]